MGSSLGSGAVWTHPSITVVHFGSIEGYMDQVEPEESAPEEPVKRNRWLWW